MRTAFAEERRRGAEELARQQERRDGRAVVYFVQRADGLIKIGTSVEFDRRVATLARDHGELEVLAVHRGHYSLESEYHTQLASHRVEGEWFRPHKDVLRAAAQPSLIGWEDVA